MGSPPHIAPWARSDSTPLPTVCSRIPRSDRWIAPPRNDGGSAMSPYAARSRCSSPACPAMATHKGRCPDHQSSGWVDRPRPNDKRTTQERLGISTREWLRLKAFVMARDEGRCHVCGKKGADEVDHIVAVSFGGSRTDPNNLAPIHSDPCHAAKTKNELARLRGQAARRRTGTNR